MLREGMLHADWCEMTMSMLREKQFEACERRLFACPSVGLFSEEATDLDAMLLLSESFENTVPENDPSTIQKQTIQVNILFFIVKPLLIMFNSIILPVGL